MVAKVDEPTHQEFSLSLNLAMFITGKDLCMLINLSFPFPLVKWNSPNFSASTGETSRWVRVSFGENACDIRSLSRAKLTI